MKSIYIRNSIRVIFPLLFVFLMAGKDVKNSEQGVFDQENCRIQLMNSVDSLKHSLSLLESMVRQKMLSGSSEFRNAWHTCRIYYRAISPFVSFYRPELAQLLNGPPVALPEEEDEVAAFLPPHGLQLIEEKLFQGSGNYNQTEVISELALCRTNLEAYKSSVKDTLLREQDIFHALELEMLRYFLLTVTNMESPYTHVAFKEGVSYYHNLPEFFSSCYPELNETDRNACESLKAASLSCADFLSEQDHVNHPDYFQLYSKFYIPLSESLSRFFFLRCPDYNFSSGPVNFITRSVFDPGAFNVSGFLSGAEARTGTLSAQLGRLLFFDPALSQKDQRSCASCHDPRKAFTDGLQKSMGAQHGQQFLRNAPTIVNAVFQRKLFHDGRAFTFENQASEVLNNPDEMQVDFSVVPDKIRKSSEYIRLFKASFTGTEDTLISNRSILKAIAAYEQTLFSLNSRFDKAIRGDENILEANEKEGFNIFMGKGKCGTCHFLPLFNGTAPPYYSESEMEVLGVPASPDTVHPKLDTDPGREKVIPMQEYHAAFKTPTLRNIEFTGPYMHNGVYTSLEQVIEFYEKGGGKGLGLEIKNQSLAHDRLNLNQDEKRKLILFLSTLSDTSGCTNAPVRLPAFDLSSDTRERIVGGDY
ncbi:MAG: hypothetical protein IPP86_10285 [Bacteroidetes bacterium]|nr:hypothetical protein [Bacteroidota bacterium]